MFGLYELVNYKVRDRHCLGLVSTGHHDKLQHETGHAESWNLEALTQEPRQSERTDAAVKRRPRSGLRFDTPRRL